MIFMGVFLRGTMLLSVAAITSCQLAVMVQPAASQELCAHDLQACHDIGQLLDSLRKGLVNLVDPAHSDLARDWNNALRLAWFCAATEAGRKVDAYIVTDDNDFIISIYPFAPEIIEKRPHVGKVTLVGTGKWLTPPATTIMEAAPPNNLDNMKRWDDFMKRAVKEHFPEYAQDANIKAFSSLVQKSPPKVPAPEEFQVKVSDNTFTSDGNAVERVERLVESGTKLLSVSDFCSAYSALSGLSTKVPEQKTAPRSESTDSGHAAVTAASCNASDVQTALNSMTASTTTITIPSCSNTVSWTTGVHLNVPSGSTSLTIQGQTSCTGSGDPAYANLACTDNTVFLDNYNSTNPLIAITTAGASSYFRITGITIKGASSGGVKQGGALAINGQSQNTRVDHNHFILSTYPNAGEIGTRFEGWVYGVFDHNLCDDNGGGPQQPNECINVWDDGYGGYQNGDGAWADTSGLGSSRFMFVENNTFNHDNFIDDCDLGGREVVRYNTINQGQVQTHPTRGDGLPTRGCRAKEVYQNKFNGSPNCNGSSGYGNCSYNAYWLSSGTGVIWGNSVPIVSSGAQSGYCWFITAHSMRADNATYTQTPPPNGYGYCGTQVNGTGSGWDQNTSSVTGYACLDQPGRGKGDLLGGNFPTRCDQTTGCTTYNGTWPNEALEPVYEWLDSLTPVPYNPGGIISISDSADLSLNTDIYIDNSSFNGTSGVGCGTLASRPSTCTPLVAYWATDQNTLTLYQCSATNTWTPYYTPYTYPHPLTQQATGTAPAPPTNLQATPH